MVYWAFGAPRVEVPFLVGLLLSCDLEALAATGMWYCSSGCPSASALRFLVVVLRKRYELQIFQTRAEYQKSVRGSAGWFVIFAVKRGKGQLSYNASETARVAKLVASNELLPRHLTYPTEHQRATSTCLSE